MKRLSGLDAAMLSFESLAGPLTVGSIWQLDWSTAPGGYSFERFRERLSEHVPALPEFRMKLADSVFNLDTPVWVDDPNFDVTRHVHRVEVPAPGTRRQLLELVAGLLIQRMDRDRPLWDIWAIEGLSPSEGFTDGVAVMHRFHHALVDGGTAFEIFSRLCGDAPDAPPPAPRDGVGTVTTRQLVRGGFLRFVSRPWHLLRTVAPGAASMAARTVRLATTSRATRDSMRVPRTPITGNVSDLRAVAYSQLELADIQTVRARFGGTVNDVVLAIVSGAIRTLLLDMGALPADPVIAAMPVAVESDRESRNNLSGTRCSLHTDIADPVTRIHAIIASSAVVKSRHAEVSPTIMLDLCDYAPGLLILGMRLFRWSGLSERRSIYNLMVSNIRPPDETLHMAGAAVQARFPFGPVFNGAGLNILVNSIHGKLNFGLTSCAKMLPYEDLEKVASGLAVALGELLDAAAART